MWLVMENLIAWDAMIPPSLKLVKHVNNASLQMLREFHIKTLTGMQAKNASDVCHALNPCSVNNSFIKTKTFTAQERARGNKVLLYTIGEVS